MHDVYLTWYGVVLARASWMLLVVLHIQPVRSFHSKKEILDLLHDVDVRYRNVCMNATSFHANASGMLACCFVRRNIVYFHVNPLWCTTIYAFSYRWE